MQKKSIVVTWEKALGKAGGSQSKELVHGAHSGCCRQGGQPCSGKKYSPPSKPR